MNKFNTQIQIEETTEFQIGVLMNEVNNGIQVGDKVKWLFAQSRTLNQNPLRPPFVFKLLFYTLNNLKILNLIQAEIFVARILNIFHTITEVNAHVTLAQRATPFPNVVDKTFTV